MSTPTEAAAAYERQRDLVLRGMRSLLDLGGSADDLAEMVEQAVEEILSPTSPRRHGAQRNRELLAAAYGVPVDEPGGYQERHAA